MTDNYAPAHWAGAPLGNYGAGRPGGINMIIIHDTEGSYISAIDRFIDPTQGVSAHYVFRSSDGDLTQCVHEADTAYAAGNLPYNQRSIQLEHEGYAAHPGQWYTDVMLLASARLVADICKRYNIPVDRQHIIGHAEVPSEDGTHLGGNDSHTDPGAGWPWVHYIQMVEVERARGQTWPTGCYIEPWALSYWQARGGVEIFGYPIVQQQVEAGLFVQYFERARLEQGPGGVVQLGLVGREAYQAKYGGK